MKYTDRSEPNTSGGKQPFRGTDPVVPSGASGMIQSMTEVIVRQSMKLTVSQKNRISAMRRNGWTAESIADIFDYDLESVRAYLHRREFRPADAKPERPSYTPPDPNEDGLTEFQRRERRESIVAIAEMRKRRNSPHSCGGRQKRMDDEPVKWSNPPLRYKTQEIETESTNVGIPEKFRGWEFQDIQYHGDMWFYGEW